MHESAGSKKEFRIFVADCIYLCEIALIVRSFIDKSAATEYLDIVHQTLQKGVVCPALNVSIVTQTAVRPDYFRECIFEPLREAVRLCCEFHDMHEIAEL